MAKKRYQNPCLPAMCLIFRKELDEGSFFSFDPIIEISNQHKCKDNSRNQISQQYLSSNCKIEICCICRMAKERINSFSNQFMRLNLLVTDLVGKALLAGKQSCNAQTFTSNYQSQCIRYQKVSFLNIFKKYLKGQMQKIFRNSMLTQHQNQCKKILKILADQKFQITSKCTIPSQLFVVETIDHLKFKVMENSQKYDVDFKQRHWPFTASFNKLNDALQSDSIYQTKAESSYCEFCNRHPSVFGCDGDVFRKNENDNHQEQSTERMNDNRDRSECS